MSSLKEGERRVVASIKEVIKFLFVGSFCGFGDGVEMGS